MGKGSAHCGDCRLAPDNPNVTTQQWRPLNSRDLHPVLEQEKRTKRKDKAAASLTKRLGVDRKKRSLGKRAAYSESQAVKKLNVIPTINSGRSFKDGDMSAGIITLDNKNQSKNENPVVSLSEMRKVREDAQRAGKPIGGLVLRNKHGVGVVVFMETDFARVLGYLTGE